jgi:hypothetical protein
MNRFLVAAVTVITGVLLACGGQAPIEPEEAGVAGAPLVSSSACLQKRYGYFNGISSTCGALYPAPWGPLWGSIDPGAQGCYDSSNGQCTRITCPYGTQCDSASPGDGCCPYGPVTIATTGRGQPPGTWVFTLDWPKGVSCTADPSGPCTNFETFQIVPYPPNP